MRLINFLFIAIILSLFFVACEPKDAVRTTFVEFNNVSLKDTIFKIDTTATKIDTTFYLVNNGADLRGKFVASDLWFFNSYDTVSNEWSGFACSERIDVSTFGLKNIYGCIAGKGATNTAKFGIIHNSATMICDSVLYGTSTIIKNPYGNYTAKSLMLTNTTYTYLIMKNGTASCKKFTSNDWFKLIITGYYKNVPTKEVDFYLADFRDGKTFLSNTWESVDISSLGVVDKIVFSFDSSDKTGSTINTPQYACIDNITLTQQEIVK